jgi:hypothetical protein
VCSAALLEDAGALVPEISKFSACSSGGGEHGKPLTSDNVIDTA